jgi:hemerythrin superfamily protein
MKPDARSRAELRVALTQDHEKIDAMFDCLVACAQSDASFELQAVWIDFERALLGHMDWEEMYLLPAYEQHAPADAAAIRADHASFRSLLAQIGIDLERHNAHAQTIEEFVRRLRAHAAREERVLYPWIDQAIEHHAVHAMLKRMRTQWKSLFNHHYEVATDDEIRPRGTYGSPGRRA